MLRLNFTDMSDLTKKYEDIKAKMLERKDGLKNFCEKRSISYKEGEYDIIVQAREARSDQLSALAVYREQFPQLYTVVEEVNNY